MRSKVLFGLVLLTMPLFGGCAEQAGFCDPGTERCPCLDDGTCRSELLMCVDGLCAMPRELCDAGACRSVVPGCYTPCSGPLQSSDGKTRACSSEGLMEGCLSGSICDHGSCIPDPANGVGDAGSSSAVAKNTGAQATTDASGQAAPAPGKCKLETDCADFQTCIAGRCYSECVQDADCTENRRCVRKVCRDACLDGGKCAEAQHACQDDVCVPKVAATTQASPPSDGTFAVNVPAVLFTSHTTDGEFQITNNTKATQAFTIRKAEEREQGADGTSTVIRASDGGVPLPWLQIGTDLPSDRQELVVTIGPGGTKSVLLADAKNTELSRWTGSVEVINEELGTLSVQLAYSEVVDGRWAGKVFYFGNFEDGAQPIKRLYPLQSWMANRENIALLDQVPNAFLQAWGRFRNNNFSLSEMQALVTSTLEGTWQNARVKQLCREAGYSQDAICAPFGGSGSQSVLLYSSAGTVNRVPSGVVELDLALNLRQATSQERTATVGCVGSEDCFVGKIDSAHSLQYGGDPAVFLRFATKPTECKFAGAAGCVAHVADFGAQIAVGGRYLPVNDDSGCSLQEGLAATENPWLVTGFTPIGVQAGLDGAQRTRRECRDTLVPFALTAKNQLYSTANPIPDGRSRKRAVGIVDGILVEQHYLLLLLKETVDPFHGGTDSIVSYAYAVLEKQVEEPQPADYVGNRTVDTRAATNSALKVTCADDLIRTVTARPRSKPIEQLSHDELRDLARAVVRGDTSAIGDPPQPEANTNHEAIHYLCLWQEQTASAASSGADTVSSNREVFDAGPNGTIACPAWATVYYFALDEAVHAGVDPSQLACNKTTPETCFAQLRDWAILGKGIRLMARDRTPFGANAIATFDLVYRCSNANQSSCNDNPLDLTQGKTFLAGNLPKVFFNPIETEIAEAFRYKTQFVSRTGKNVGFAPSRCEGSSDLIPYCYDPDLIEDVAKRVDCAVAIYNHHVDAKRFNPLDSDDADTIDTLRLFLRKNFAAQQTYDAAGAVKVENGFERLNAELLIMLGDDAYTQAFASRFDLAGTNQLAFDGDKFETNGVALSGAAGFEMYTLYEATQYYSMVLDRFYSMAPLLWSNLARSSTEQYLSEATITSYIDHVVRASTQSAAAWSEVARRYQAINRADLARTVLERAYTRAYQESMVLSQIMTEMVRTVSPPAVAQVATEIENAQRRYRVAMLDMSQAYARINDEVNFFGLSPNYIPFPALDEDDVNGFEVIFERARQRAEAAAILEAVALASKRDFDVDEAAFQGELVSIRNSYESQLGELCGTFTGVDGRIYPAISRYSHLDPKLAKLDDPCGAAGNGDVFLKGADLQSRQLEMTRVRQQLENLRTQFNDSIEWVAVQCKLQKEDVAVFLEKQKAVDGAQSSIEKMEGAISGLDKALNIATTITQLSSDGLAMSTPWGKIGAVALAQIWWFGSLGHFVATTVLEDQIRSKQSEIRDQERKYQAYTIGRQCDYLSAELVYTLRGIQRDMDMAELDALQATWNTQAELSELQRMAHEKKRLEAEWEDTDQLTINVAAASNDPNIRIYKNDAIINADRSFRRALQEAYRATRIYEYYTASTYANFEKLFLIRMVNAGDVNLSRYLDELEDTFNEFEDQYGNPDTRVALFSMRDDVLKIPRYSLDGKQRVLSTDERVEMFRQRLTDGSLIDSDGSLAFKFSSDFKQLSPLTANHKILFVEVDMYGDTGDPVGRVYLSQTGTGVVQSIDSERHYFTFPARTAVMNPVFNGDRSLGQDADGAITGPTRSIYRSYRFRERPFVQTNWELKINQRTESVNTDINLGGIDDIVVSVFYTDFTP